MEPLIQPILQTDAVRLRPFAAKDAALIRDASVDALIPSITSVPSHGTEDEILAFIRRQHDRLRLRTGYSFAIADAHSDVAMGQIGLWLRDADRGRVSIGYWVGSRHRRHGIASAALAAISDWGLTLPGVHRVELYVEPANEGSWRVAERCGFLREGLLRGWQEIGSRRRDMYMYSRLE
ncbi:GNAT family N-acetyltransferase [Microbacterium saperdae]|uniref:RimJ/RimL family protein N-acetyltransferase n=1 Tax=Microbacterium saperdae TaxID=69368 RepID=A0A543BNB5_9MICO|nr:GNAT family N-acetyltransferase [Microbacterium saperdae]TQL86325.1 RimJ/RimL family protein N-acetyltransferase [Microbacterium saperdae]GGM48853.1 N-acetyltransferase [Microbacterium saperdae]